MPSTKRPHAILYRVRIEFSPDGDVRYTKTPLDVMHDIKTETYIIPSGSRRIQSEDFQRVHSFLRSGTLICQKMFREEPNVDAAIQDMKPHVQQILENALAQKKQKLEDATREWTNSQIHRQAFANTFDNQNGIQTPKKERQS